MIAGRRRSAEPVGTSTLRSGTAPRSAAGPTLDRGRRTGQERPRVLDRVHAIHDARLCCHSIGCRRRRCVSDVGATPPRLPTAIRLIRFPPRSSARRFGGRRQERRQRLRQGELLRTLRRRSASSATRVLGTLGPRLAVGHFRSRQSGAGPRSRLRREDRDAAARPGTRRDRMERLVRSIRSPAPGPRDIGRDLSELCTSRPLDFGIGRRTSSKLSGHRLRHGEAKQVTSP